MAPSGTGIKHTRPVNGSRSASSPRASGDPPPAFVLEPMDGFAGRPRSQTALRTRLEPAGQPAQSRHSRSPKAGWPQRSQSGRGYRLPAAPAELAHQGVALARGHRCLAQEARRRQAASARPRPAPQRSRGIDRGAHDLDRGPHAGEPALERRGALRHEHASAVGRAEAGRAHGVGPRGLAPRVHHVERDRGARRRGGQRQRIAAREAERRGIDDGRCSHRPRLMDTPSPRAQSSSRRRRSAERLATATGAPRSRAAPTAARAPPPVPITSHGPGGVSSSSRAASSPGTSVLSPTVRAVLAPEGVAGAEPLDRRLRTIHRLGGDLLVRHRHVAAAARVAQRPDQSGHVRREAQRSAT